MLCENLFEFDGVFFCERKNPLKRAEFNASVCGFSAAKIYF